MKIRAVFVGMGLLFFHTVAGAQQARPEDVSTIDGIIRAYYEVVSGPAGGLRS